MSIKMNDGEIISFANEYEGHGLREQAKELERCVTNNIIESPQMKHSDSIAVMESIDQVREMIGLDFNS